MIIYTEKAFSKAYFRENFTLSEMKIFNHLIGSIYRLGKFYFSWQQIAIDMRVSRDTVKRAVKKFVSLGLIGKQDREWSSSILSIPSLILDNIHMLASRFGHQFSSFIKISKKIKFTLLQKAFSENAPPLYRRYITPCRVLESTRGINTIKNKTRGSQRYANCFKLERNVQMEAGSIVISPTLREITQVLHLSRHGQLKLLAFPDRVLSVVWAQCKMKSQIRDPFSYLIVQCDQYSVNSSIKPNWDLYYSMLKRYNIDRNAPYVRKSSVSSDKKPALSKSLLEPRWKQLALNKPNEEYIKYIVDPELKESMLNANFMGN